MKIQVITQSFYPDHSGIFIYSSDFAFYAAEKGHEVEVLTGFPFYPQWKKKKEHRRKIFATECIRHVKVLRAYIYVPAKTTTFQRVLHEFSLLLSASLNFFRAKRPDVIVVFTTPILLGNIASIFKKLYRCKLVINVQDFQLEAASSLGMTKQNAMFSILSALEKCSYKSADLVTTISHSMYNILKDNKNLDESKIYLWPNWIQKADYSLNDNERCLFRAKYNIHASDKIIAYAGNIGLKQGLEVLIDLADTFKENPELKFFIIGGGTALNALKQYAADRILKNLYFLPLLTPAEYKHFLNDLDIFFLPQKKTKFDVYFPSKLLGLMVTGKMILLSADKDSELYKTVQGYKVGFATEFGDLTALKMSVKEILTNVERRNEVSSNATNYVAQFERQIVLDGVLKKMEEL